MLLLLLLLLVLLLFAVVAQTAAGVTDLLEAMSLEVSPLSHTPPNALKAYGALVLRLKKSLQPLLGVTLTPRSTCVYGHQCVAVVQLYLCTYPPLID